MPGGLTVLYGFWPFDNPPLLRFRPALLVLDILCGGLLTVMATVIPLYWLRVRERPVQFTLRGLLGLTTAVACGLSAVKIFDPDSHWRVLEAAVLLPPLSLLYGVPAGLVIVAAHWVVARSAKSARRCRRLGVHWLTWLALVAVGGPLLHYSLVARTGYVEVYSPPTGVPLFYTLEEACGWPLKYLCLGSPAKRLPLFALPVDVVIWLAITVATGFVVERWVRRVEQRIPMRPTAFYSFLFVACVVIWALSKDDSWRPPWYDWLPWLFGIVATVYAVELLVLHLFARHVNVVAKISLFTGLGVGTPLWLALSDHLGNCGVLTALVAGAFAAAVVDAGYRLLSHPDKGIARFVRRDCGGCVAAAPLWIVATAGAIGGVLLICWRS